MKKTKQPGDNISLKTKKTEDSAVMNWINAQSNLMDSLRYLIENEIVQNGVRNLQTFVPMERNSLASALRHQVITREIGETREEISVARSVQLDGPEQPVPSIYRTDTKLPVAIERSESEPSAKDDIDDDDIEAWI
jgi:hypothetical protein